MKSCINSALWPCYCNCTSDECEIGTESHPQSDAKLYIKVIGMHFKCESGIKRFSADGLSYDHGKVLFRPEYRPDSHICAPHSLMCNQTFLHLVPLSREVKIFFCLFSWVLVPLVPVFRQQLFLKCASKVAKISPTFLETVPAEGREIVATVAYTSHGGSLD